MSQLSEEERKLYTDIFREIDKNGDGTLSRQELAQELFPKMGVKFPNEKMFDEVFDDTDKDKDGTISLDEFLVMCQRLDPTIRRTADKRRAFKEMDVDDIPGQVSKDELFNYLEKKGMPLERQRIDAIFEKADTDKNGQLSWTEFLEAFF